MDQNQKAEAKEEIGEFLVNAIIDSVTAVKSPVLKGKYKKSLSPKYKKKKGSGAVPDMKLKGDMLSHLEFEPYRDGIEVGIFDEKQAQKADNHNKFSAKSKKTKVPPRQFIPDKKGSFVKDIDKQIAKIIKEINGESNDNT